MVQHINPPEENYFYRKFIGNLTEILAQNRFFNPTHPCRVCMLQYQGIYKDKEVEYINGFAGVSGRFHLGLL